MRLDKYLVHNQMVTSRAKAKSLIEEGHVQVNQKICSDVSTMISEQDQVVVDESQVDFYVSRSAHKLKAALDFFQVKVDGLEALDIGMSTGGFTQVLLELGAKKVVGVDVGHDQLHLSLKNDVRVECFEGVNVKEGLPFTKKFSLIVVDVSFISVTKIIHVLIEHLEPKGEMFILVKPQFEQTQDDAPRKLVLSDMDSRRIAQQCRDAILKFNLKCSELYEVPLKGKEGNQEYFLKCSII
jgi:23S rRNA (cytidine1920-2'-O)/16S rRNA (cytidine1409-2'-O)-methyltransferase